MLDLTWMDQAACVGLPVNTFFPKKSHTGQDAKRICASCPVRAECLRHALSLDEQPLGIWAGLPDRERSRLKRVAS